MASIFRPTPASWASAYGKSVSKEAWAAWLKHQTMLVNENRLNLADARARQYLARQMENHFFGDGADAAQGYVPPQRLSACRPCLSQRPPSAWRPPSSHWVGAARPAGEFSSTAFDQGQRFWACWRLWRDDLERPQQLHLVGLSAHPPTPSELLASAPPDFAAEAIALAQEWIGLLPGFHRFTLSQGRLLLTLCVGETRPAVARAAV